MASDWNSRKHRLFKEFAIVKPEHIPFDVPVNIAVRILEVRDLSVLLRVIDLDLAADFRLSKASRKPRLSETLLWTAVPDMEISCEGRDCLLLGATIVASRSSLPDTLIWPATTCSTGHVYMPTETRSICQLFELFSGGMAALSPFLQLALELASDTPSRDLVHVTLRFTV